MAVDDSSWVKTLLSSNWTAGNTDSKTPTFSQAIAINSIPSATLATYDEIVVDDLSNNIFPSAIGGQDGERKIVQITIQSDGNGVATPRDHALKVRDEVKRIIRDNYGVRQQNKYEDMQIVREVDMSNQFRKIYKIVIDMELFSQTN